MDPIDGEGNEAEVPLPPARFETARLVLRKPELDDAQRVFAAYAQDPEVCRFLRWRPHRHLDDSVEFVRSCLSTWSEASAFPWVLESRDTGQLLGMLEARLRPHVLEFGYVLAQPHWGQGLMVEAAVEVVAWALAQPSIFRVWAVCDVDNIRSARVLEKLGLQHEGVLRRWLLHPQVSNEPRDCKCYARVR